MKISKIIHKKIKVFFENLPLISKIYFKINFEQI